MYSIFIVLGIIAALIICACNKNKYQNNMEIVVESSIISLFFGIIGARIYFVLFNMEYYKNNLLEVFNLRDGGLAIYGGLILGAISLLVYCKIKKISFLNFMDYIVPSIAIAQAIGRFGNFFNQEAYGYETNSLFRMGINTYEKGFIEVHPTFLYESVCNIIICIILLKLQNKRKFKGQILLLYLIFYSFIRFFIEGLRQDSLMFFDFRISQIVSILTFLISIIFYNVEKCSTKNQANNDN